VASPSQREAIEAPARPLLVLAVPAARKGPSASPAHRFLIENLGSIRRGSARSRSRTRRPAKSSTARDQTRAPAPPRSNAVRIHAFCAELLRELGAGVLLEPGFGIADEEYQLSALRRIEGYRRWHRNTLNRFSAHRFRGDR
jgi:superfamily I DNA/RNA helicase